MSLKSLFYFFKIWNQTFFITWHFSNLLLQSDYWLPAVAGHTLTYVQDTKLIVIGGFSTEKYFLDNVLIYDSAETSWEIYPRKNLTGVIPLGECSVIFGSCLKIAVICYFFLSFLYCKKKKRIHSISNILLC